MLEEELNFGVSGNSIGLRKDNDGYSVVWENESSGDVVILIDKCESQVAEALNYELFLHVKRVAAISQVINYSSGTDTSTLSGIAISYMRQFVYACKYDVEGKIYKLFKEELENVGITRNMMREWYVSDCD